MGSECQLCAKKDRARQDLAPDVLAMFLVDGFVAGTWQLENGLVRLEPFARMPRETRRELEREARELSAFHAV